MNSTQIETKKNPVLIVADAFADYRSLLRRELEQEFPGWIIVEASGPDEAVAQCRERRADFVLLEVSFPDGNGVEAAARIRDTMPHVKVCLIGTFESGAMRRAAERAGCIGFISKGRIHEELFPLLRSFTKP